ncbi:MAG: sugar transferase [Ghiorsea sp.]|nr:sugar transferase [Ghiorsea sp.]
MLKRTFDAMASLLLLVPLLPVLLGTSVLILLDSKGGVFYRQERVGRFGKTFYILKFRSMVANADQIGGYSTSEGDVRITKVGGFLRKTSLDELPQVLNVLLGDMSLVGPRPDVPAQRQHYSQEEWDKRNSVRPGITGLAQATLRSTATPRQRTMLDLEYVDKQSFLFDMKILLMTVKQVVGKGSY